MKNRKKIRKELSLLLAILTLSLLQGFSSRETDFHLCQFLSNFLRYSALNFPSSEIATMQQTDSAVYKLKLRSFHKSTHL